MLEAMLSGRTMRAGDIDYNSFVSSISSLAVIADGAGPREAEGYRKITMRTPTGTMWGTPYGNKNTYDSVVTRVAQHCFPDTIVLNENVAKTRLVVFKFHYLGQGSGYVSLNRNGYLSSSYGNFGGSQVLDFIYFDVANGCAMRCNPLDKTEPVPWDGKFL